MHHSIRACKLVFLGQILVVGFAILIEQSYGDALRYPGAFGDPHFTGWDGVNFDFTGEEGGVYCMISDEKFHMNMKLGGRTKQAMETARLKHDRGANGQAMQEEEVGSSPSQQAGPTAKHNRGADGQAMQEEEVGSSWLKQAGTRVKHDRSANGQAMQEEEVGSRATQEEEVGRCTMQDTDVGGCTKQKEGAMQDRDRRWTKQEEEARRGRTKRKQTWIKEIGIMYRGHRVEIAAKEGGNVRHKGSFMRRLEINGEEKLSVLKREGDVYVSEDKGVRIEYEKKESYGVMPFDLYKVVLGCLDSNQFLEEIVMKLKVGPEVPEEREPDGHDAFFHLSVEMVGGRSDFWTGAVHGLLGQSLLNARGRSRLRGLGSFKTSWNPLLVQMQVEGPNGDGYLDGNVSDYVASGLLNSDCQFSRFNPNLLTAPLPTTVSSGYSRRFLPGFSPI